MQPLQLLPSWHGYGFWLQVRIEVRLMAASNVVPRFWTSPTLFSSSRLILPPFVIAPPSSRQSSSPALLSVPLTHRVEDSAIITSFNSNIVWPREHLRDRRRAEFNVMVSGVAYHCFPFSIIHIPNVIRPPCVRRQRLKYLSDFDFPVREFSHFIYHLDHLIQPSRLGGLKSFFLRPSAHQTCASTAGGT